MNFKKKHGFFCHCEMCKIKRRQSLIYLASLIALIVVILYQAFILIFITSKINALLLFIELIFLIVGICRMLL